MKFTSPETKEVYRIVFRYPEIVRGTNPSGQPFTNHGRVTVAELQREVPKGAGVKTWDKTAYKGSATRSDLDLPVRELGRRIALARAIMVLPRSTRRAAWQAYWERTTPNSKVFGSL